MSGRALLGVSAYGAQEPGTEPAALLGRKGLLGKDQATLLALCAVHRALGLPAGTPRRKGPAEPRVAVVVASNLGNVAVVGDIARGVHEEGPRAVSPMLAPAASSNVIAGAIAIWFRFGGPNVTVCSGATAGLDAIWLAGLLLRAGRAGEAVVVGVEPDDPQARAVHDDRAGLRPGDKLTGGAYCLVLTLPAPDRLALLEAAPHPAVPPVPVAAETGISRYGAAGVAGTCAAVEGISAGERRHVLCGDPVDGYRELWVSRP